MPPKRRLKKIVEPEATIEEPVKIDEPTEPYQAPPEIEPAKEEPKYVIQAKPPLSKDEQILAWAKNHPPLYAIPTSRQWGEIIWPWLHELETIEAS